MDTPLQLPSFPQSETLQMQRVWTQLQLILKDLYRWHRFTGLDHEIRLQDLLQHSLSITFLGGMILERLRHELTDKFDDRMLLTALVLHDVGEGILKRDVSLTKKQTHHDVAEYEVFCNLISNMPEDLQYYHKCAFLLQFVLDEEKWGLFDADAQVLLAGLAKKRRAEAIMFMVIEHWDYIMYMVEQYEAGNAYLLYEALKTEVAIWPRLKELCPAFGILILTPEIEAWFTEFRRLYVEGGGDTRSTDEIKGKEL